MSHIQDVLNAHRVVRLDGHTVPRMVPLELSDPTGQTVRLVFPRVATTTHKRVDRYGYPDNNGRSVRVINCNGGESCQLMTDDGPSITEVASDVAVLPRSGAFQFGGAVVNANKLHDRLHAATKMVGLAEIAKKAVEKASTKGRTATFESLGFHPVRRYETRWSVNENASYYDSYESNELWALLIHLGFAEEGDEKGEVEWPEEVQWWLGDGRWREWVKGLVSDYVAEFRDATSDPYQIHDHVNAAIESLQLDIEPLSISG